MNGHWSRISGRNENCCLWFMARDHELLGDLMVRGRLAAVTLPLDAIARTIVGLDAAFLFMVHNHPSGDMRPSAQDISATRQVWRTARAVGASLQDHYIFGAAGCFSFRDHGLL